MLFFVRRLSDSMRVRCCSRRSSICSAYVVSKAQPSLHAAYQTRRKELSVSLAALYEKTARVEPPVTRELVRRTGERMREVVIALESDSGTLFAGFTGRIVDE